MSYVRVSILGASPGGEVWSINPVFDPNFEWGTTVDQTALDNACNAIAALTPGTTALTFLSTALTITGARCEVRDDTNDALIAISTQVRGAPLPGTSSPLRGSSSAAVISLRSNTPGGSGRGRIYWPAVGMGISTDLRLSTSNSTALMTDIKSYLNAIRGALATAFPTIGFDLAIRSRATHTTIHVNKLQIGNVLDTQRRRRDKMVEDYTSTGFPTWDVGGSSHMGPWIEYSRPDDAHPQHQTPAEPRRARRLITPRSGDAFFVYGEYDDGNGMWIVTGVSP